MYRLHNSDCRQTTWKNTKVSPQNHKYTESKKKKKRNVTRNSLGQVGNLFIILNMWLLIEWEFSDVLLATDPHFKKLHNIFDETERKMWRTIY